MASPLSGDDDVCNPCSPFRVTTRNPITNCLCQYSTDIRETPEEDRGESVRGAAAGCERENSGHISEGSDPSWRTGETS